MDETTVRAGRPRSERARQSVLHAVDGLLLEVGYGAMTMKGIAERAGVGRQTVYRWWSTKAEVLAEASADDAEDELDVGGDGGPEARLARFLDALLEFLTVSPAGIAYRALLAAAQHDAEVAELLAGRDPVIRAARRALEGSVADARLASAAYALAGPAVLWVLAGESPNGFDRAGTVAGVLAAAGAGSRA